MKISVLDHGYVEWIEGWGHGEAGCHEAAGSEDEMDFECGIIEAARQSTQGSFRGWERAACNCRRDFSEEALSDDFNPEDHLSYCDALKNPGDARLLSYLYNNNHATPFEFAGMVIEVQAPIFVFREWHRHRTQSYNEMSARYAPLPDLNYVPTVERIAQGTGINKQASSLSGGSVGEFNAENFQKRLIRGYQLAQRDYEEALAADVPKELARLVLPVGRYSKMRASANLRNWLAFMTLRCDPRAQWEIRQYAEAVANIIAEKFPQTFKLWSRKMYGEV